MSGTIIRPRVRQWDAGRFSKLSPDWNTYTRPVDIDIRTGLPLIRARCRELVQNSDHAKGFVRIVRNNIVGQPGFVLQSRAQKANGKPDMQIRNQVEREWLEWGRKGNCEVSGKFSWKGLQRHVIETVARDGEAFIRILDTGNRWGFQLQVIDPEAVDIGFDGEYQGREIRMGVEIDEFRRPAAYWTLSEPKFRAGGYQNGDRARIPAAEMIHVFLPEFCWQTRGVPWLATAAQRLHMIQGTEDAEVTASRGSAAKFAAYEAEEWAPAPQPNAEGILGPDGQPLSTDPGAFAQDLAPGSMETVPYGYRLKMLDPQHPNSAMPDFLKWGLRSVATGMGVSYNTLGNDAEGVNYTSLRFFLGVERDHWMEAQDWFGDDFVDPIRWRWTDRQIELFNLVGRANRINELHRVKWQPRRWEGPDPAKQAQSDEVELRNGTTNLTAIYARKGIDLEDAVRQRVDELVMIKQAAEAAGLTLQDVLPSMVPKAAAPAQPQPGTEPDADETED